MSAEHRPAEPVVDIEPAPRADAVPPPPPPSQPAHAARPRPLPLPAGRWSKWVAVVLWFVVVGASGGLASQIWSVTSDDQLSWFIRRPGGPDLHPRHAAAARLRRRPGRRTRPHRPGRPVHRHR